jgi:hypothetical protein
VVAAAAAPLTILISSCLLVVWAGGPEQLSRAIHAAGPCASLVLLVGLAQQGFLALKICNLSAGRVVPLAVMLGLATLPWTVGLLGTEAFIHQAAGAPSGAQAMASRMLGAWVSAALLLGLGLGLAMTGTPARAPWRPAPRGSSASVVFGVLGAFALAAIALVGALEAHRLFETLSRLPLVPLSDRESLLTQASEDLARLRTVRLVCQGALVTLGAALLGWRALRASSLTQSWVGSAFLAAAITALLVLDAHAAQSAAAQLPQSSQNRMPMAASSPTPITASISRPSDLEDGGTFGAATEVGAVARNPALGGCSGSGRAAEYVTTEASWSSRPSRARDSTRFMWSM